MQDAPSQEERMFKDKTTVRKDTPIKGVRMGAGERSYLVRDNQIDVLKNMYGGVQVSLIALTCSCCPAKIQACGRYLWPQKVRRRLHDAFRHSSR